MKPEQEKRLTDAAAAVVASYREAQTAKYDENKWADFDRNAIDRLEAILNELTGKDSA